MSKGTYVCGSNVTMRSGCERLFQSRVVVSFWEKRGEWRVRGEMLSGDFVEFDGVFER